MGTLIILIDLIRLPLIVRDVESQFSRSLVRPRRPIPNTNPAFANHTQWASIEIMGACVVANAAFYSKLVKDLLQGHGDQPSSRSGTSRHETQRSHVWRESYYLPQPRASEGSNSRELDNWGDSRSGSDKIPIVHKEFAEV